MSKATSGDVHRQQLGSLGPEHSMQRFQASQHMFGDYSGAAPTTPEAALADSLYASVARQLQSGAGPAQFPQVRITACPSAPGCTQLNFGWSARSSYNMAGVVIKKVCFEVQWIAEASLATSDEGDLDAFGQVVPMNHEAVLQGLHLI